MPTKGRHVLAKYGKTIVLEIRTLQNIEPASDLGIRWESLVQSNPASGFMQSLYWAEVKRKQGLSSFHFGIFAADNLVGGAIFYSAAKRNGAGILIAPEGPVLPWDNEVLSTEALKLLMDAVQAQASDLGIMAIRIEPRLSPPLIPALREFGKAPVDLVPKETLYIDLSPTPESILESMRTKGRYNIALASRHEVTVSQDCTAEGVKEFHAIVSEASHRDDFALEPISFFEHLASVLCPVGHARFLFSKHEGETLGALLLITYGSMATYLYGGISNRKRNLMSGYGLQWAAMNAAKALGCTIYDFYGFDSFRSPEHNYARFSQFKSQFGGKAVRFIGAQDYFLLDNLADAFIKAVNESQARISSEFKPIMTRSQSLNNVEEILV
jgi:peptidoglycan pentaglycine glycine transferase (the first glycine)